jgi:hypothetical protein
MCRRLSSLYGPVRLSCFLLFLGTSHAKPQAGNAHRTLGASLTYGTLVPSPSEWAVTFPDDEGTAVLHVWLTCAAWQLRGYLVLADTQPNVRADWAGQPGVHKLSKFHIFVGKHAAHVSYRIRSGIRLAADLSDQQGAAWLPLSVKGWAQYFWFPLSGCAEAESPRLGPPARVFHVWTVEGISKRGPAAVTELSLEAARHAAFHACLLNLTAYELLVSPELLPALAAEPRLQPLLHNGTVRLVQKPTMPAQRHDRSWEHQALYFNLAILERFNSHARIFLLDLDEYIFCPEGSTLDADLLLPVSSLYLQRRFATCPACVSNESATSFADGRWLVERHEMRKKTRKLVINPSMLPLVYIHGGDGNSSFVEHSHILHLDNLHHFRDAINVSSAERVVLSQQSSQCDRASLA